MKTRIVVIFLSILTLLVILQGYEPGIVGSKGGKDYDAVIIVAQDNSGDFTDIQEAIDSANSSVRTLIKVVSGLYDLNPKLNYPYNRITMKSNITLIGAGINSTIIRMFTSIQPAQSNVRSSVFFCESTLSDVTIEDLTIIMSGTPDNCGESAIDFEGDANTNITIRRVKTTNCTGAGISIRNFKNLLLDSCIVETAWTGIILNQGSNANISSNEISNVLGDAIFPQVECSNILIEKNSIEYFGDTGIDITARAGDNPHNLITVKGNKISHGIDAVRVTHSNNVEIVDNTIFDVDILSIDSGQGSPINVTVRNNDIREFGSNSLQCGIGGSGTSVVIDNNTLISSSEEALWAINTWSDWAVTNNHLSVPTQTGDNAVRSNGVASGNY